MINISININIIIEIKIDIIGKRKIVKNVKKMRDCGCLVKRMMMRKEVMMGVMWNYKENF